MTLDTSLRRWEFYTLGANNIQIDYFNLIHNFHIRYFLPFLGDNNETYTSNFSFSFQNAMKYELASKWGKEGSGHGEFNRIHDLNFNPNSLAQFYFIILKLSVMVPSLAKKVPFSIISSITSIFKKPKPLYCLAM